MNFMTHGQEIDLASPIRVPIGKDSIHHTMNSVIDVPFAAQFPTSLQSTKYLASETFQEEVYHPVAVQDPPQALESVAASPGTLGAAASLRG